MAAAGNRRGRATRERLLDAAEAVLAERGLDLTVDDVAQRAGTSRPTVHRHFGRREDLLVAVLLRASTRLAEDLEVVWSGPGSPRRRLEEVVVRTVLAVRGAGFLAWLVTDVNPGARWPEVDPDDQFLVVVRDFYRPKLAEAGGPDGAELRAPLELSLDWLLRCILSLVLIPSALGDDEGAVRRDVATFVVPGLLAEPGVAG